MNKIGACSDVWVRDASRTGLGRLAQQRSALRQPQNQGAAS